MKHRIKIVTQCWGRIEYTPQYRLFGIWLSYMLGTEGGGSVPATFDSIGDAWAYIDRRSPKRKPVVIDYVYDHERCEELA